MAFEKINIKHILFATDLSENANRAFSHAMGMAHVFSAKLTILHVLEKIPPNAEMLIVATLGYRNVDEFRENNEAELAQRIRDWIESYCEEAANQVPECRLIPREIVVEPGKAVERILHHTRTGRYDMLVIGSRGHGLLTEAVMGGVTRKVVQDCRIPVHLVPLMTP